MKKLCMSTALAAIAVLVFGNFSTTAKTDDDAIISAHMVGLGEVPPNSSKGVADFRGTISSDGTFADVVRAIRTHNAYANLHTTMFSGGEVRGEVGVHGEDDE